MIAQDETVYYDRAFIKQLYGSGFHLSDPEIFNLCTRQIQGVLVTYDNVILVVF